MRRHVLTVGATLALSAIGYADISTFYVGPYLAEVEPGADTLVPDFNDGSYWTVDIMVAVTNDDDWTSSSIEAVLNGGEFFYHPFNRPHGPVRDDIHDIFPGAGWDTLVCTTEPAPANFPDYQLRGYTGHPIYDEQYIGNNAWWDTPPNGGDGAHLVVRLTIKTVAPVWLHVQGHHTTMDGGGTPYPYGFDVRVPEPASLALLILPMVLVCWR